MTGEPFGHGEMAERARLRIMAAEGAGSDGVMRFVVGEQGLEASSRRQ
jgi:hypothetical protein